MTSFQNKFDKINLNEDLQKHTKLSKSYLTKQQHPIQFTYKIKDGLYLGTSSEAFKDQEFILLNWIEHVIIFENQTYPFNTELKYLYGQQQDQQKQQNQQIIRYLHCNQNIFHSSQNDNERYGSERYDSESIALTDAKISKLNQNDKSEKKINSSQQSGEDSFIEQIQNENHLSLKNKTENNLDQIFAFIQKSCEQGSSCLILSSNIHPNIKELGNLFSLCCCYLMKKYKWSLFKALQFMNWRVKDVQIHQKAYDFLNLFEIELLKDFTLTYNWNEYQSRQQLIVRNTFLNSKRFKLFNQTDQNKNSARCSSRQKIIKNKKIEHSNKRIKTQIQNKNTQNQQFTTEGKIKSILKISDYQNLKTTSRNQRNTRASINLSLNQIQEYQIKVQEQDEIQVGKQSQISQRKQNKAQNQLELQKQTSFLSTSRIRQISLSVSKIVAKYRQQKITYQSGHSKSKSLKSLSFDHCYDVNIKGMQKKKSLYNFHSNRQDMSKSVKDNDNQEIKKIIHKIKQRQELKQIQTQNSLNRQLPQQKQYLNKDLSQLKVHLSDKKTKNNIQKQRIIFNGQNNTWIDEILNNKKDANKFTTQNQKDKMNLNNLKNERQNSSQKNKISQIKIYQKNKIDRQKMYPFIKKIKKGQITCRNAQITCRKASKQNINEIQNGLNNENLKDNTQKTEFKTTDELNHQNLYFVLNKLKHQASTSILNKNTTNKTNKSTEYIRNLQPQKLHQPKQSLSKVSFKWR